MAVVIVVCSENLLSFSYPFGAATKLDDFPNEEFLIRTFLSEEKIEGLILSMCYSGLFSDNDFHEQDNNASSKRGRPSLSCMHLDY
jgi:hypothetical protein